MTDLDLKGLERKTFRSTHEDGLLDLFLGVVLLALAFFAWLGELDLSGGLRMLVLAGLEALAVLGLIISRKVISEPRIGKIRLGPAGKTRQKKARWLVAGSVIMGLALLVFTLIIRGHNPAALKPAYFFPAMWAANALIVFGLAAWFLDYTRLYGIGIMFAICVPLDMSLHEATGIRLGPLAFALPGFVVLAVGITVLLRFLHTNPRTDLTEPLPAINESEGS